MRNSVEYLIIGQGLAGSLICQELIDAGKSVLVIDNNHQGAASGVAAGIINPITGRRFVKSWKIDELIPFAEKRFAQLASLLNQPNFYQPRQILRCLFSQMEQTDWLIRTAQKGWKDYVLETDSIQEFKGHIEAPFAQGILLGAQVDLGGFIQSYRKFLISKQLLIADKVGIEDFDIEKNRLPKHGISFQQVIWAEGSAAIKNPHWNFIDFEPAKGEVFHLRIPGLETKRLLKHKMMMAPLGNELFWFGANYEWNAPNDRPSEMGAKFLQKRLDAMIPSYEKVAHFAAIRPTIRDRRPVLGQHPKIPNWYIFNGLGTKGASLGPYFARHLANYFLNQDELLPEINVHRFRDKM